jgi:hypothetical protein
MMTVNCETANMRKKEVVAHFKVNISRFFAEAGKHVNSWAGQLASGLRIEP